MSTSIHKIFAAQYFCTNSNTFQFWPILTLQFMSVNVQNVSVVMMNNTINPSWFLHATAGDLHLDGSTLHSLKTLVVTAALSDARVSEIFAIIAFLLLPNNLSLQNCLIYS